MNTDLVQLRWNHGQLEYRTKWIVEGSYDDGERDKISDDFGDWQAVPGVKGDDSDKQFE